MNLPKLIRPTSFSVYFLLKNSFRCISSSQSSAAACTLGYRTIHPTQSPISGGTYFIPTRAIPIRSPVKRLYAHQSCPKPLDEDNEEDFDTPNTSSLLEVMKEDNPKLGFVGAGMMATALINGFIANKATEADVITVSDVFNKPALDRLSASGVRTAASNVEAVAGSRAVFLAVKPDVIPTVLQEINGHVSEDTLIVSIAMGVSVATLEQLAPGKRIVRVMPNTPCLVSEMAAAFCMGSLTTKEDKEIIDTLLGSVGYACEVHESKLDAVTGLSGSGPAYVYMMIEALADGGVRMGLPRSTALKLAAQTVKGAATMVLETETHPAVLKDQVCSPGGSTIAAVEALEQGGFRAAAIAAVVSATNKCIETRNKK